MINIETIEKLINWRDNRSDRMKAYEQISELSEMLKMQKNLESLIRNTSIDTPTTIDLSTIPEEESKESNWTFIPLSSTDDATTSSSIVKETPEEAASISTNALSITQKDYSNVPDNEKISTTRSTKTVGNGSWTSFRDTIYKELEKNGFSGETAKTMVALMGLETGSGSSMTGDYNFGNITKSRNWKGRLTRLLGNHRYFKSYDSFEEAISDYARLCRAYGIKQGDSKEEIYKKWLGHNSAGLAWNGVDNIKYANKINKMYTKYWN